MIVTVYVLVTPPFVAVNVTRWVPGVVKLADGLVKTDVPVEPNVQRNVVPVIGVVVFVKFTTSGAQPETGLAVNPADTCAFAAKPSASAKNKRIKCLNIFILCFF